mmetsp:Transcript_101335/g.182905  ORF Transcript_101335/g.182905 Transcript_101335/m.182905 type:complete len:396 (-) Transcript_101335:96-1283(-)
MTMLRRPSLTEEQRLGLRTMDEVQRRYTMRRALSLNMAKQAWAEPKKGFVKRIAHEMSQQPEAWFRIPLWFYRVGSQGLCASILAAGFLALGGGMISQSWSVYEVKVAYGKDDVEKTFTLEQDIEGEVFVSYELSEVSMNRRDFVESKDKRTLVQGLGGATVCEGADTRDWAGWRRAGDKNFLARINATPGTEFAPCGLVAISMFTDDFAIFGLNVTGGWGRIAADESDIAIPADATMYAKKLAETNSGVIQLQSGGVDTWLTSGSFFEHWKVWCRTPASAHVRNLWAVIRGGLKKGQYKVQFLENSPIWESWGVPQKYVILSGKHTLGSKGALAFLGAVCLAIAALEAIAALGFLSSFLLRRKSREYVSEKGKEDKPMLINTWGKSTSECTCTA